MTPSPRQFQKIADPTPVRKTISFRWRDIGQLGKRWPLLRGVGAVAVGRWVRQPDDSQLLERVGNRQPQERRRIRHCEGNSHREQHVSRSGARVIRRSHGRFRRQREAAERWCFQRIRSRDVCARCDRLLRHDGADRVGIGGECREIQHGPAPVRRESFVSQCRWRTGEDSEWKRPQVSPHFLGTERSRGRGLRGHRQNRHRDLCRWHETLGKELSVCCRGDKRGDGECQARGPSKAANHVIALKG